MQVTINHMTGEAEFKPLSRAENEWLKSQFAHIEGDMSLDESFALMAAANAAGFGLTVGQIVTDPASLDDAMRISAKVRSLPTPEPRS